MKRSTAFLLLSVFFFSTVNAGINKTQPASIEKNNLRARVYFSTEVPSNGIAKEGKEFYIDPSTGNFVYCVVDNYPDNFVNSQLVVKIFKTNDKLQLVKWEEKTYDISTGYYYTYIKYSFYSAGTYTFDVYTPGGTFLGSGSVEIKTNAGSSSASNPSSSSSSSSDPYIKSKVYFSTEVPSYGVAKDVKSFRIKSGGGYVYTVIDNYPTNFISGTMKVYIYKMTGGGEYVKHDETTYTVSTSNYFTYFKYTFYNTGDYKFVIYDGNNKYINTGYVTVNWE
jgi:hypothetical protein